MRKLNNLIINGVKKVSNKLLINKIIKQINNNLKYRLTVKENFISFFKNNKLNNFSENLFA